MNLFKFLFLKYILLVEGRKGVGVDCRQSLNRHPVISCSNCPALVIGAKECSGYRLLVDKLIDIILGRQRELVSANVSNQLEK